MELSPGETTISKELTPDFGFRGAQSPVLVLSWILELSPRSQGKEKDKRFLGITGFFFLSYCLAYRIFFW